MRIGFTRRLVRCAIIGASVVSTCSAGRYGFSEEQPPKKGQMKIVASAFLDDDQPAKGDAETDAPDLWLGIGLRDASKDLLEYVGREHGVIVANVMENSPAAKADIKSGDILLSVDGKELRDPASLIDIISKLPEAKGEAKPKPLKLSLLRKGQEFNVELTPESRPANLKRAKRRSIDIEQVLELDDKSPEAMKEMFGQYFKHLGKDGERIWSFGAPSVMGPGTFGSTIQGDFDATVVKEINGQRLEVSIQRKENQPAKIVVKEGDKSTEYTEKQLNEIPEAAREIARSLLGSRARIQFRHGVRIDPKKEGAAADGQKQAEENIGSWRFFGGEPKSMFIFPRDTDDLQNMAEEMAKHAQKWTRDAAAIPADVKTLKEEVEALRKEIQELRSQLKAPQSSGK